MERGEEVSRVERVEYQVENELIDALTKHLSDNDARVGSAPLIALNDIWLERDAKKEHDKLKAEIHEAGDDVTDRATTTLLMLQSELASGRVTKFEDDRKQKEAAIPGYSGHRHLINHTILDVVQKHSTIKIDSDKVVNRSLFRVRTDFVTDHGGNPPKKIA